MLDSSFNNGILKIIDTLAFPMYVISIGSDVCTCVNAEHSPDINCPKCLGTGHRIRIRRIAGAMEPDDVSIRLNTSPNSSTCNYYYFNARKVSGNFIKQGNIIVRDNEADILQTPKMYRSDSNKVIYYYCQAIPMKNNLRQFMASFRKVVEH